MRKCCLCLCDILTGCRIVAVALFAVDIFGFLGSIGDLANMWRWIEEAEAYVPKASDEYRWFFRNAAAIISAAVYSVFVWRIAAVVVDTFLLIGFFEKKPSHVVPWLVFTAVVMVVWAGFFIAVGGWFLTVGDLRSTATGACVILFGLLADGAIFLMWIHVQAGHQALKEEEPYSY